MKIFQQSGYIGVYVSTYLDGPREIKDGETTNPILKVFEKVGVIDSPPSTFTEGKKSSKINFLSRRVVILDL